jgi:ABC-type sugar transport system substrate-binding protein
MRKALTLALLSTALALLLLPAAAQATTQPTATDKKVGIAPSW